MNKVIGKLRKLTCSRVHSFVILSLLYQIIELILGLEEVYFIGGSDERRSSRTARYDRSHGKERDSRGPSTEGLKEDVEKYLSTSGITVEEALKRNEENQQKYKIVECSFVEQLTKLKASVDDYEKSLAALAALDQQKALSKEGTDITYKLDENLYSKARVKQAEKICIYLGANVMVEYGMVEGREILEKNLKNVNKSAESISEELDFIRDQITTTEVNVAQLHNYRVEQNCKRSENYLKKKK